MLNNRRTLHELDCLSSCAGSTPTRSRGRSGSEGPSGGVKDGSHPKVKHNAQGGTFPTQYLGWRVIVALNLIPIFSEAVKPPIIRVKQKHRTYSDISSEVTPRRKRGQHFVLGPKLGFIQSPNILS